MKATAAVLLAGVLAVAVSSGGGGLNDLSPAAGGAGGGLALHKALYALDLAAVGTGAGVTGIRGTMYYEQDDACDAWTTDQRFTIEYQYSDRRPVNSVNHYVTWEAKDGARFEFTSERQENGKVSEHLRGAARRGKDAAGKAVYVRPEGLAFDLPAGYLLPGAHTAELIRRARAGETLFYAPLFDGTDAEGPVMMSAFIGRRATREEIGALAGTAADSPLLAGEAWHMRMAVFPLRDGEGITPAYEMDTILHDNGVTSYARIDYGVFSVSQKLETVEPLPAKPCPAGE